MSLIDDANKATRLARAIVADLLLYNEEKVTAGLRVGNVSGQLADEIEEGRKLYLSRVTPNLVAVFEHTLDQMIASRRAQLSKDKEETIELEIPPEILNDSDAQERRLPAIPDLESLAGGKTQPLLSLAAFADPPSSDSDSNSGSGSGATPRSSSSGGGLMIVGGLLLVGVAIAVAVFILS